MLFLFVFFTCTINDYKSQRLIKYAEIELLMKTRHPTSISNIFAKYLFITHTHTHTQNIFAYYLFITHTHTHTHTHTYIYIYIYIYHHVVPLARISLTLSRHFSLSFIASGRSSGLHPVSSHSCWMYVRAGRPAFARPYVGVHRSTSPMSSSLLLQ